MGNFSKILSNRVKEVFRISDNARRIIDFEKIPKYVQKSFLKAEGIFPVTRDVCLCNQWINNEPIRVYYYLIEFIGCHIIVFKMELLFDELSIFFNFDNGITCSFIDISDGAFNSKWIRFLLQILLNKEISNKDQIKLEKYLLEII